jgi:transcriptional regulator with XRE-family HTH domain
MKVRIEKLRQYLKENGMSNAELARDMGVSLAEVTKMLDGEAVGVNTTRKFIRYFTADEAQDYIDWEAIGKTNPFAYEEDDLPAEAEQSDGDDEVGEESIGELIEEDYYRYGDGFDEDDNE